MKSVLVLDPLCDWYKSKLAPKFPQLEIRTAKNGHSAEAEEQVRDVDAILGMGHHFHEGLVDKAGNLKWIQAFTTGVDQIVHLNSLKPGVVLTSMNFKTEPEAVLPGNFLVE